ncbi:hypothetical protein [Profundibacterium mesophilum]|uniref:Curlin minor subunit CsgB n=1 Tax=Profundibacterium mesophilum KAUST100406-0324 TaxID=1037889 RepID=A0A921NVI0_9RHOB|nr:hypothetical protein [Profundibacterium mesophilum]KAF0676061.1 curlin minor subunit CsgB [Profundibacterium mesophilum KAUST100406-0324]
MFHHPLMRCCGLLALAFPTGTLAGNSATLLQAAPAFGTQGNEALIDQGAGTGNSAGTRLAPLSQTGSNNDLSIIQAGTGNRAGTGDSVSGQIAQRSDAGAGPRANLLALEQMNGANLLRSALQVTAGGADVPVNMLKLTQKGANRIGHAEQRSVLNVAGNIATLVQDGARNRVRRLFQESRGSGTAPNEIDATFIGSWNGRDAFAGAALMPDAPNAGLVQRGSGNRLELFVDGDRAAFGTRQIGTDNEARITAAGHDLSLASVQLGDQNRIELQIDGTASTLGLLQDGSRNRIGGHLSHPDLFAELTQVGRGNAVDLDVTQTGNRIVTEQRGPRNHVDITQATANNTVNVTQLAGGNSVTVLQ